MMQSERQYSKEKQIKDNDLNGCCYSISDLDYINFGALVNLDDKHRVELSLKLIKLPFIRIMALMYAQIMCKCSLRGNTCISKLVRTTQNTKRSFYLVMCNAVRFYFMQILIRLICSQRKFPKVIVVKLAFVKCV